MGQVLQQCGATRAQQWPVMVRSTIGKGSLQLGGDREAVHCAQPAPRKCAMFRNQRRIHLTSRLVNEQPSEFAAGQLDQSITPQCRYRQTRQEFLVNPLLDPRPRDRTAFGDDRRASRPNTLDAVHGRPALILQRLDASWFPRRPVQLIPRPHGRVGLCALHPFVRHANHAAVQLPALSAAANWGSMSLKCPIGLIKNL